MAMSAITANLQHRKWTRERLDELERETMKALGDCVILVQELSVSAGGTADEGLGERVHANSAVVLRCASKMYAAKRG